jgi:AraC family transcriptional regulator, transcriptional activator of pobA
MHKPNAAIRVAKLSAPFVYRTMEAIEAARQPNSPKELPHRHDFYTIIAVEHTAGGVHEIDFKHYDLSSNTLYFLAPGQVHHLEVAAGTAVQGHAVMFTTDFLLQHSLSPEKLSSMGLFFNCDESKPLTISAAEMQGLGLFFQHFTSNNSIQSPEQAEIIGAWLKLLLYECKRLKELQPIITAKLEHRQGAIVRRFKDDVERYFSQWHQVGEYATSQHLTSNYLNEIIKSETGNSAKDMIQNRIILEAKRLARYSDLTAKEIAFRLGYEDVAHFSKFFKKCSGITFSAFKENIFSVLF